MNPQPFPTDRRALTQRLAEDLVEEFCGAWPDEQKRRLVAALVEDAEADPLRDCAELFGVAAAAQERRLVCDVLELETRGQELQP